MHRTFHFFCSFPCMSCVWPGKWPENPPWVVPLWHHPCTVLKVSLLPVNPLLSLLQAVCESPNGDRQHAVPHSVLPPRRIPDHHQRHWQKGAFCDLLRSFVPNSHPSCYAQVLCPLTNCPCDLKNTCTVQLIPWLWCESGVPLKPGSISLLFAFCLYVPVCGKRVGVAGGLCEYMKHFKLHANVWKALFKFVIIIITKWETTTLKSWLKSPEKCKERMSIPHYSVIVIVISSQCAREKNLLLWYDGQRGARCKLVRWRTLACPRISLKGF